MMYDFTQGQLAMPNALARSQPVMLYVCPDDTLQINEPQPGELGAPGNAGVGNWQTSTRGCG